MNKIIEWLFQRMSDGATHLQVIIVSIILCFLISIFFKILEDVKKEYIKAGETDDV